MLRTTRVSLFLMLTGLCMACLIPKPGLAGASPEAASTPTYLFARAPRTSDGWTNLKLPSPGCKELVERRDACSKAFRRPDGKITWETHMVPIHYRDKAGAWQNVDLNLRPSSGQFHYENTTNSFESYFPRTASAFHRFKIGTAFADFAMVGASSVEPTVCGESIAYQHAAPGVDLQYTIFPQRLKEDIILTQNTGQSVFSFEVKLNGLRWRNGNDGTISFTDDKGTPVCFIPKPFMYDKTWTDNHAKGIDDGAMSEAVKLLAAERDGKLIISLIADREWLNDPARVYPVVIDPSWQSIRNNDWPHDTCVNSSNANWNYGTWGYMRTGARSTTYPGVWRAMIRFNDPPITNTEQVCSCRLFMCTSAIHAGGYGHQVYRRGINDGWSEFGATWNNTGGASHEGGPGTYRMIDNGNNAWFEWSWDGWGPWLNDTGYVLQADDERTSLDWSVTWWASTGSVSSAPYLQVDYDDQPPAVWINNPWRPAPGTQVFNNTTTLTFSGQAIDWGCRGLAAVQVYRWGYCGSTDYYNVSSGYWDGGWYWWTHSQCCFYGHNRFHFRAIDCGTLCSTEWNSDGGSDWLDVYTDPYAPENPRFSGAVAASPNQVNLGWGIPLDVGVGIADGSSEDSATGGDNHYRVGDVGVQVRRNGAAVYGWGIGTSFVDDGLSANTPYTYDIAARDNTSQTRGGWNNTTAYGGTLVRWTLSIPPSTSNITCNKAAGTLQTTPDFEFTAAGGFGPGKVDHYLYTWDNTSTHQFGGSESSWNAGAMKLNALTDGKWYLHVQGLNGEGVANGTLDLGPFLYTNAQALDSIGLAFAEANSVSLALKSKPVTAALPGMFWIEEPNRTAALRVISGATVAVGDWVDVAGNLTLSGAQRVMFADTVNNLGKGTAPQPIFMTARSLGGSDFNAATPGVSTTKGLYTIGMLVRVAGHVSFANTIDPNAKYFYLDDGSTYMNDYGNLSVKVLCGTIDPPVAATVIVTGIISSEQIGPDVVPTLIIRNAGDVSAM